MKIYVTYQIKPTKFVQIMANKGTDYYAVKCDNVEQAREVASDVAGIDGATYVRINQCGNIRHKKDAKIVTYDEYWKKNYDLEYK